MQRVPPLSFLCLRLLSKSPESLYRLFGLVKLHLFYDPNSYCSHLDPCLWASLIQIFNHTRELMITTYRIHLLHDHLPLLQRIPHTPHFTLITLLELPACSQVTDDSVSHFINLHSLVALDLSGTKISHLAIKRLAQSLRLNSSDLGPRTWHGPWPLRILRLYDCRHVDNLIFPFLSKFPLLCVLDLRGTQCIPRTGSLPPKWDTSTDDQLFFPYCLSDAVDHLTKSDVWSSQSVFRLLIDSFHQPSKLDTPDPSEGQTIGLAPGLFYGKPNMTNDSSGTAFYEGKRPLRPTLASGILAPHRSKVMLCRDCPVWSALIEAVLDCARDKAKKPLRKREEVVAVISGAKQKAALTKLQQAAQNRKEMGTSSAVEGRLQKMESRNPFLKRRRDH